MGEWGIFEHGGVEESKRRGIEEAKSLQHPNRPMGDSLKVNTPTREHSLPLPTPATAFAGLAFVATGWAFAPVFAVLLAPCFEAFPLLGTQNGLHL